MDTNFDGFIRQNVEEAKIGKRGPAIFPPHDGHADA